MKKKVLVIFGSPRKGGNSDLLCEQFIAGASESGHQVERVFLRDKNIKYCIGCGACMEKKICHQKDDMTKILDQMVAAEVIVMATPVYFYTMDAQMKTFIDRTVPRYTEISNKEFYFIATAADSNKQAVERTFEGFRGFTSCLEGAKEKGLVYGVGAWDIGAIKGTKAMIEAYEMGKGI
jgi:multimeric flavodoxin WrbA